MRRLFIGVLSILVLSLLAPMSSASAQTSSRCFPETGFCISGAIRQYWERNGGLPVFGYPTTALANGTVEGWTGPIQWFERDRLEDHNAQGQGVLAGRLGAERLEQTGRPWRQGNDASGDTNKCRFYAQTGYTVCDAMLTYWDRNGGLERFGYPITSSVSEVIGGQAYQVQYFERRRMELHPENQPPYNVLLGLLGNEVRANQAGGSTCSVAVLPELQYSYNDFVRDSQLGCPVAGQDYSNASAASARFEHGQMYWINLRGGQGVIYVIAYGANNTVSVKRFDDLWREGDPVDTGLKAPTGLYEPRRGFGKIWREQPGVREALGWALENERAETISLQVFEQGTLAQVQSEQITWQFFNNGGARSVRTRYY